MKLFIYGVSGSGKSYLSKKISEKLDIGHLDLDDIFWKEKYDLQNSEKEFKVKLSDFIKKNKSWVIEGVFTSNVDKAIKSSDKVIFLDMDKNVSTFRIIKRYIGRMFTKNEGIKDTIGLIKCARSYKKKGSSFEKQIELVEKYKKSYLVLKKKKDVISYIKSL